MASQTERTPPLQTKFPSMGTTIFTVMSALATEKAAVNLGQGFPDFECDPRLVDAVDQAMRQGGVARGFDLRLLLGAERVPPLHVEHELVEPGLLVPAGEVVELFETALGINNLAD